MVTISLFNEGMKSYNEYLKTRFGFIIRERERYHNYFRLAIHSQSDNEIERIRKALDLFTYQLRKDIELFDVLYIPKMIVRETISNIEDIYSALEFKVGLRKQVSGHADTIKLVIMVASFILTLITVVPTLM